jgi:hypothetical protein
VVLPIYNAFYTSPNAKLWGCKPGFGFDLALTTEISFLKLLSQFK